MRRRQLVLCLAFSGAFMIAGVARAQPVAKPARIVWIGTGPARFIDDFQIAMRALGHAERRTYLLDEQHSWDDRARLEALVEDLRRRPADLIVAIGGANSRAVAAGIRSIPIVVITGDPVAQGMAASLARPGGNVTDVSLSFPDIALKWLDLTKAAVPALTRALVLADTNAESYADQIAAAAPTLRMTVVRVSVRAPADFDPAFRRGAEAGVQAVIIPGSSFFAAHRQVLIDTARRYRLPAMYEHRAYVDDGGLMSYGPNLREAYRRVAYYVDRVLKGAKPADLPIEQPTKFELVINLKTAKALGLTIPESILVRADEVIE